MKRIALLLALILSGWFTISLIAQDSDESAPAPPPLPSSFYGTVQSDSGILNAQDIVSAAINETEYAQTNLVQDNSQWVYTLKVPADNPSTEPVEGGQSGDTVTFYLDNNPTGQTAVWQSGTNKQVNLLIPNTSPNTQTPSTVTYAIIAGLLIVTVSGAIYLWRRRITIPN